MSLSPFWKGFMSIGEGMASIILPRPNRIAQRLLNKKTAPPAWSDLGSWYGGDMGSWQDLGKPMRPEDIREKYQKHIDRIL